MKKLITKIKSPNLVLYRCPQGASTMSLQLLHDLFFHILPQLSPY